MAYTEGMGSYEMDAIAFRNFIFQGKALFSVKTENGNIVTLSIKSPPKRRKDPEQLEKFYVELKSINGVYQRSRLIGYINRNEKKFSKVFGIDDENPGVSTINWIITNWSKLEEFKGTSFYHKGYCCKCGKELSISESIENGIGPQCIKYREAKTLEIIKELGVDTKGLSYVEQILRAIEKDESVYSRIYIPHSIRRNMDVSVFEDLFEDILI